MQAAEIFNFELNILMPKKIMEMAKKKLQGEDVGFNNSVKWNFEGVGQVVFDGSSGSMAAKLAGNGWQTSSGPHYLN